MEEYSVHQLKPEDFDILIPLMKDCFGMNVNVDYFRWKFLQNPAGPVIGFYALSETGECVCYYGGIPEKYIINGVPRTIYQSTDLMTHSKHRRRGLFQKLEAASKEFLQSRNALFTIALPGGPSAPGFIKFGWRPVFDVFFHFKPKLICRLETVAYKPEQAFSGNPVKIVHLTAPDDIFALINKSRGTSTISLDRSPEFIKWKLNNPLHDYHIIALMEKDNFVGYCIYYLEANKMMLLDAYCENRRSVFKKLFNGLNTIVTDNGLMGIITFAQRKTALSALLLSNNFFINTLNFGPLHKHLQFVFYATKAEIDMYNSPEHWSITALDHDAF